MKVPSAVDCRRLRNGETALVATDRMGETLGLVRAQLEAVDVGIAALQSLDDLGPEANEKAERDHQELWKRRAGLEKRLKELEGNRHG